MPPHQLRQRPDELRRRVEISRLMPSTGRTGCTGPTGSSVHGRPKTKHLRVDRPADGIPQC